MDGAATIMVRKDLNMAVTTGNGLAGGTYNLDVQGTNFGLIGAVSDLRLTLANSVVGLPGVNAGTVLNPQINRTGLTLANLTNTFYVGSINSVNTPLPITLISFTASVVNGEVELNWSTAAEINNNFFTIQRSKDAPGWENVQKVAGGGTSSVTKFYTAYDQTPYTGTSYYRLMQTDIDGRQTYSPIVSVNLAGNRSDISVYPNPATYQIMITFPVIGKYEVALINLNGQIVNNPVITTGDALVMNVSGLNAGIYFIIINHEGNTETKKMIINK
jgi:hypothetical protein